ncbi:MAG: ROK family protein [Chthoniobacterales bacterium]|nr:ROK family protein [Chthoniobacterales bacterium]
MSLPDSGAPLDRGFVPAWSWRSAYRGLAEKGGCSIPVTIAIMQPGGCTSVFRTRMLPDNDGNAGVNFHYLERTVKFLLWSRGGSRVHIAGAPATARRIAADYAPEGARAFDAGFLGRKIYLDEFAVTSCDEAALPAETENAGMGGGGLEGCRIGFDLGGSDRKVAAVIDGKVVFSEETPWDPYFQADPAYHEEGIRQSLRRAAEHLPRVDAIGGSAAGVYVDNEPRAGSLFRGVPEELFASRIRPIFKRLAAEWKVPLVVANDGDVTALAAAAMPECKEKHKGVLGLSLGTSLAGGYVGPDGSLRPWLNELAFVPVDYRVESEGAHVDEWSGDAGTGARYHSQQALGQLLAGREFPGGLPFAEKLALLQQAAERGENWVHPVYESLGVYLGFSLAHFAEFYEFSHVLVLGRVTSGPGGEIMMEKARQVLSGHAPDFARALSFLAVDEKFKRHGQAIAAASLPRIESGCV